jgi:hypothetical protein
MKGLANFIAAVNMPLSGVLFPSAQAQRTQNHPPHHYIASQQDLPLLIRDNHILDQLRTRQPSRLASLQHLSQDILFHLCTPSQLCHRTVCRNARRFQVIPQVPLVLPFVSSTARWLCKQSGKDGLPGK